MYHSEKQGRDENIGRSFRVVLQDLSHFYCVYDINVEWTAQTFCGSGKSQSKPIVSNTCEFEKTSRQGKYYQITGVEYFHVMLSSYEIGL